MYKQIRFLPHQSSPKNKENTYHMYALFILWQKTWTSYSIPGNHTQFQVGEVPGQNRGATRKGKAWVWHDQGLLSEQHLVTILFPKHTLSGPPGWSGESALQTSSEGDGKCVAFSSIHLIASCQINRYLHLITLHFILCSLSYCVTRRPDDLSIPVLWLLGRKGLC